MMVLFTSRSEKKAIPIVRRILDCFADRIGNDTWQTVITHEGLQAVNRLLRRTATKSTAVSCRWIRSRSRSQLLWIVGNRQRFDSEGRVPVNWTAKNILHNERENEWSRMPELKALTALASLLHDWGKCSDYFQAKLREHRLSADPFRHEWISCKLLEAVVHLSQAENDDAKWLTNLASGNIRDTDLQQTMMETEQRRLEPLPPVAEYLAWIILSHHRLPLLDKETRNEYREEAALSFEEMFRRLQAHWGYEMETGKAEREACFTFSHGLLCDDGKRWQKEVKKWAGRLAGMKLDAPDKIRPLLLYSRLCLMLADHYISSQAAEDAKNWDVPALWANTDGTKKRKQYLEEHLVRVMKQALTIAHSLPQLQQKMERVCENAFLKKQSKERRFQWQDKAVAAIHHFRSQQEGDTAYFVVNIASTGCGKTMANAKIMQALSKDEKSLRYILALGLRTLTLQTGDEYRERIGLDNNELAVLIGSVAVKKLHDIEKYRDAGCDNLMQDEAESAVTGDVETLLDGTIVYEDTFSDAQKQFLELFFNPARSEEGDKNRAFLNKPVLVATIDYLMRATETIRGGKYMLPLLRLLSSDLVIDEIDDFGEKDLIAVSRLVHLAGMLGRNVVLSSATIPLDLAIGMHRAYMQGLKCYNQFFAEHKCGAAVLCDEFKTSVAAMPFSEADEGYIRFHREFIKRRAAKLMKQQVRRKGYITPVATSAEDLHEKQQAYFEQIRIQAEKLHDTHHCLDKRTGKEVSFGLIRMANIDPCVALSLYLLKHAAPEGYAFRVMVYHSRQLLLLRHEQEAYLDSVLKRKGEDGDIIDVQNPVLRQHIDKAAENKILFVLVATPVEEVGRDHDFDWAVIEPSSYRSIIQLSGRILRHRSLKKDISSPNVAVMQYNLRAFLRDKQIAFCKPGYESSKHSLVSHDMMKIIDVTALRQRIDAVPRIEKRNPLHPEMSLVDLEQRVMEDFNSDTAQGPEFCNGWLKEYWWLTALPQVFNPFRENTLQEITAYRVYQDGKMSFRWYDGHEFILKENCWDISMYPDMTLAMEANLWLRRDYMAALKRYTSLQEDESEEKGIERTSKQFGEIVFPASENISWYYSDQLGLFKTKAVQ